MSECERCSKLTTKRKWCRFLKQYITNSSRSKLPVKNVPCLGFEPKPLKKELQEIKQELQTVLEGIEQLKAELKELS